MIIILLCFRVKQKGWILIIPVSKQYEGEKLQLSAEGWNVPVQGIEF